MSQSKIKDVAASVRQRLLNLSRERGQDFQLLLTHYALERFLYRLSISDHAGKFVLKGALLFMAWTRQAQRITRDLDLLGMGEDSTQKLVTIFREIQQAGRSLDDGLEFDDHIQVEPIREDQSYQGLRVRFEASLGAARVTLQIDVGFGDTVIPQPEELEYPTLLGMPAPRIKGYPKESVVSEKLQALVALGMANSRMKDFYDLWTLGKVFSFEAPVLVHAIRATFQRRSTALPGSIPIGLSDEFAQDDAKGRQWNAFISKNQLDANGADLASVIADLRNFLLPPLLAAAKDENLHSTWQPGDGWR